MTLPPIADLALFMALVLVLALYGLAVSGHFPVEHRAEALRSGGGRLILWGTMALAMVLTVAALVLAWSRLPLYASVLGGGAMLLAAPLVLQPFPDSFVNGRRGLVSLTAVASVLALTAYVLRA
jgi:hypothetical protein